MNEIKNDELSKYIACSTGDNTFSVVNVTAVTDFCSRSEEFRSVVDKLASLVAEMAVFKEKLKFEVDLINFKPANSYVYKYHNGNRLAIVTFDKEVGEEVKPIAVQCVAGTPKYLSRENVSDLSSLIATAKAEAIATGKPEAIAEKIAMGKVSSQLKEYVFLEQTMYNENITVATLAERLGVTIVDFFLSN